MVRKLVAVQESPHARQSSACVSKLTGSALLSVTLNQNMHAKTNDNIILYLYAKNEKALKTF